MQFIHRISNLGQTIYCENVKPKIWQRGFYCRFRCHVTHGKHRRKYDGTTCCRNTSNHRRKWNTYQEKTIVVAIINVTEKSIAWRYLIQLQYQAYTRIYLAWREHFKRVFKWCQNTRNKYLRKINPDSLWWENVEQWWWSISFGRQFLQYHKQQCSCVSQEVEDVREGIHTVGRDGSK